MEFLGFQWCRKVTLVVALGSGCFCGLSFHQFTLILPCRFAFLPCPMSSQHQEPLKKKKKKSEKPLSFNLASFYSSNFNRLIIEEVDPKSSVGDFEIGPDNMVMGFHVKDISGNEMTVYCGDKIGHCTLDALQWRRLGMNLGLSGSSKLSIQGIQISLAIHATQEKTIQSTNIVPLDGEQANVRTTAKETEKKKRHNTLIRTYFLVLILWTDF